MTKDQVLEKLLEAQEGFVSGEALARELCLSRAAVWKAVEQLRREGYRIESVPHRGYCLTDAGSRLSVAGIRRTLRHRDLDLRTFRCIDSTNTALKHLAEGGAPQGLCLIAEQQTGGRGRMGRSFYSPPGSGVYMSLLLRPDFPAVQAGLLTAGAAVAAAEAIEELTGKRCGIKWVNDIVLGGKKVCGILTEGALEGETGRLQYAVVGLGFNLREPPGGFPPELRDIAGAILDPEEPDRDLICRLPALVLDKLMDLIACLHEDSLLDRYRSRCFLLGKPILIHRPGQAPEQALALDLTPEFSLIVERQDGSRAVLHSGEVSIRPDPPCAKALSYGKMQLESGNSSPVWTRVSPIRKG